MASRSFAHLLNPMHEESSPTSNLPSAHATYQQHIPPSDQGQQDRQSHLPQQRHLPRNSQSNSSDGQASTRSSPIHPVTSHTSDRSTTRRSLQMGPGPGVAAAPYHNAVYFGNWGIEEFCDPRSIDFGVVTRIYYAHARIQRDGTIALGDENPLANPPQKSSEGCLRYLIRQKSTYSRLKVLLALGGEYGNSANFKTLDQGGRERFARSAQTLVLEYGLDGIDVYWDSPRPNYQAHFHLFKLLRQALPFPKYLLTCALPGWEMEELDRFHIEHLTAQVDTFNVMCYDFHGPWSHITGHQSQLQTPMPQLLNGPSSQIAEISVSRVLAHLMKSHAVPSSKILLGIPAFGYAFQGAQNAGVSHTAVRKPQPSDRLAYKDLLGLGLEQKLDAAALANYSTDTTRGFITYDNPDTVRLKARFAQDNNLAGLFYVTAQQDTADPAISLVHAGYNALFTRG